MLPSTLRIVARRSCKAQLYTSFSTLRSFSQSSLVYYSRKGSEDKVKTNVDSTEYSKSDTDDSVAPEDVAFDPKKTSPETEKETAGKERKVSSVKDGDCFLSRRRRKLGCCAGQRLLAGLEQSVRCLACESRSLEAEGWTGMSCREIAR